MTSATLKPVQPQRVGTPAACKRVVTDGVVLHGSLTRYVKLRVAYAPGIPGTFSPPSTSKVTARQRSQHALRRVRHARGVMHVGIANPRRRGRPSCHSRRMRNPQFYVSGQRPMLVGAKCYHLAGRCNRVECVIIMLYAGPQRVACVPPSTRCQ